MRSTGGLANRLRAWGRIGSTDYSFSVNLGAAGPWRVKSAPDQAHFIRNRTILSDDTRLSDDTSLGMSRGIPGYPGGLPRGSAGEAGPVPPRPLHPRRRCGRVEPGENTSFPHLHRNGGCCN